LEYATLAWSGTLYTLRDVETAARKLCGRGVSVEADEIPDVRQINVTLTADRRKRLWLWLMPPEQDATRKSVESNLAGRVPVITRVHVRWAHETGGAR
jgi:hypothetical protein